jgi:hypothetical protein
MDKRLLDQLSDGDPISVALRGGAGWIHGSIAWRREDVLMIKVADGVLPAQTPYALVFLGDVSALGVPHELEPPTPEPRSPGFMRN